MENENDLSVDMVTYAEARERIANGDVIFLRDGRGIAPWLVRWATDGDDHHVAIAFWVKLAGTRRLMAVESNFGGRRIISLGAYCGTNMDVVRTPVDWERIAWTAVSKTGQANYGYRDLYRIALREKFGLRLGDPQGEVCSEFSAKLLIAGGMSNLTPCPSPSRHKRELLANGGQLVLEIRN